MAFRMPGEFEPHERTLMAWPVHPSWGGQLGAARDAYAELAAAVTAFEPLTMLVNPDDAPGARRALPEEVELVEIPYETAWQRDSGPIVVIDDGGGRAGIDFAFNAWGGRFPPWDLTAAASAAILDHLGIERIPSAMVLEGGAITVDGEGTLITTEQCLLNPNRNPGMSREDIEAELARTLGITTVIWLPFGITADLVTDGHVDAVCTSVRPGAVLFQGCDDPGHPDFERMGANRRVLEAAADAAGRPLEIIDLPTLPEPKDGLGVAYANIVLVNGGVILGVGGDPADIAALEVLRTAFPDREVAAVGGTVFSYAGGGPHCTTMQIPRGGT
jgi:agmatine deiminase